MTDPSDGYKVDYFVGVVRRVLDGPLAEHGFDYAGQFRDVGVYWARGRTYFSVGYMPETIPDYELIISVGEHDDPANVLDPAGSSVGVWRFVAPDLAPKLVDWRFDSPEALARELRRAWSEVIVPYVLPALEDEGRLGALIGEQNDDADAERERLMDDRLLRFARGQFQAGEFARSAQAYDELPPDALTAADRKRQDIARRRM